MNLVTLALLVIDAKRLDDERARLREELGVPPWPVVLRKSKTNGEESGG